MEWRLTHGVRGGGGVGKVEYFQLPSRLNGIDRRESKERIDRIESKERVNYCMITW